MTIALSTSSRRERAALAALALVYLPLLLLGYGTDVDVFGVRRAASALRDGDYRLSRPPGSIVHEGATAVLDLAGPIATNLGSLVLAVLLVRSLLRLAAHARSADPRLPLLLVVTNPFFVVAATSLVDHVWAVALLVLGLEQLVVKDRPWAAGLLWAAAVGVRLATLAPVLGILVALLALRPADRPWPARAAVLRSGALGLALGLACYVPAWAQTRSFAFLHNEEAEFRGWALAIGRWGLKNTLLLGIPASIAVLVLLLVCARRWRVVAASDVARPAVLALAAYQVTYLRFPWKIGHLVPALVLLGLLLAVVVHDRRRLLVAALVGQLVWACVAVRVVTPDNPNDASGGRISPAIVWGPLVEDVRCRVASVRSGADGETYERSVENWLCTNEWWSESPTIR